MYQISSSSKDELNRKVAEAKRKAEYCSHSLVLVVLEPEVRVSLDKDSQIEGVELINVSKSLSQRIVCLSANERIKRLEVEFKQVSKECKENVWLSKLDLLFEPSLNADPIRLLKWLSKSRPVVAIWPGQISGNSLFYSEPGLEDYRTFSLQELKDIQVVNACNGVI